MGYMMAAYIISSVSILGYVALHSIRRAKLIKEIEFLKQLDS
ncbi:CcmD family protein [Neobacillus sp. LXY-4]